MGRQISKIDNILAKNLRQTRILSGISQKVLAEHLGVTFQQVQKYEQAKSRMSAATIHKLVEYFQIPYEVLYAENSLSDVTHKDQNIELDDITLKICRDIMTVTDPAYKRKIRDAVRVLVS